MYIIKSLELPTNHKCNFGFPIICITKDFLKKILNIGKRENF